MKATEFHKRVLHIEFAPRVLWRRATEDGHVFEAVFVRQVEEFIVAIHRDGQARDARAFAYQSDAIAWAEQIRIGQPY